MRKLIIDFLKVLLGKRSNIKIPGHNGLSDTYVPEFVVIGKNFISAPGSIILAHDASTIFHSKRLRVEKTTIGDNVFVGANAVIMPGVNIGNGSIIGAGSVVTKDIPEYVVAAGNPAKIISTVSEYILKCEERCVLYEIPSHMLEKRNQGLAYSIEDIIAHRIHILKKYRARNRLLTNKSFE